MLTSHSTLTTGLASSTDSNGGQSSKTLDFVGHTDRVLCTSISHDGRWVFSGSNDCSVQLWDAQTAQVHMILCEREDWVRSIDISSAGNMFATGSDDGTVRICKLYFSFSIIKTAQYF